MPLLRHAKKKLKQDKKRTAQNRKIKSAFRSLLKKARVEKTLAALSSAFSEVDKAAKQNIIHKNKAAHLKSALSKVIDGKAPAAQIVKPKSKARLLANKKAIAAKKASKKKSATKRK